MTISSVSMKVLSKDVDDDVKSELGSGDASSSGEDMSSSFGGSGSGYKVKDEDNNFEKKEVESWAKEETLHVQISRALVIVVLLMTGGMFSIATFLYLKNQEKDTYRTAYDLFTRNIHDASTNHVGNIIDAFRALSETVTAYAISSNSTFPFVTMPLFEVHGDHARAQSGIEVLTLCPILPAADRAEWESYSVQNQWWIAQSRSVILNGAEQTLRASAYKNGFISPSLYEPQPDGPYGPSPTNASFYVPMWQSSPPPFVPTFENYNLVSPNGPAAGILLDLFYAMTTSKESVFSPVFNMSAILGTSTSMEDHQAFHSQFQEKESNAINSPHFFMMAPIFQQINHAEESDIVGLFLNIVPIDRYVAQLLPDGVHGIYLVVENSCGQVYTYELVGNRAEYKGEGDSHDPAYDDTEVVIPFSHFRHPETSRNVTGQCLYSFHVYSSGRFTDDYTTTTPFLFTLVVAVVFGVMAVTFFIYDSFVRRRNLKVVDVAARSNAIVASMFPSTVRDRLFAENQNGYQAPQTRLKSFLNSDEQAAGLGAQKEADKDFLAGRPIADLFPNTTVMFADIVGFTAWSSVREPTQVFTLLETLYRSFDEIAKKRRVFKVETVGDCYVAVCGLPDPRKDHAVVMARFARDCMFSMQSLTKKLEVTLGPDTGDLSMRIGLHSGPVTAGVLRGERARFQLFGDTMNTAARIESNGLRDRVQLSEETAELLIKAGKKEWITPRKDVIHAKGKGEMKTYWLEIGESRTEASSVSADTESGSVVGNRAAVKTSDVAGKDPFQQASKVQRLIDWNCEVLIRLLKQIVARRKAAGHSAGTGTAVSEVNEERVEGRTVLDEVKEIIALPKFNAKAAQIQEDLDNVELDECVKTQLQDFVSCIAAMYRDNPFHNFEHASHVTMSVVKLLSRIVAPVEFDDSILDPLKKKTLHDHTYGITSDPLTQFACVFSALIHDVDHTGVPNAQLVQENAQIALLYKGKSVAEQNSVDLSWALLMQDSYRQLRSVIYADETEKRRFRQLVVNSVMATDITDKELKALRNARWEKAFSDSASGNKKANASPTSSTTDDSSPLAVDADGRKASGAQSKFSSMHNLRAAQQDESISNIHRKATIVIEHLIQASDVAHTMQHWHIYRKWNERLYQEMYKAYCMGRGAVDPANFWYEGELGFFDFYIIPLAKKLKECGVFGVSSDEYLNYAEKNRQEWQTRGKEIVSEMAEKIRTEYQTKRLQRQQQSDGATTCSR